MARLKSPFPYGRRIKNGIELELTFLKHVKTKGIGIDSGIDKKELKRNLELIKRN